MQLLLSRWCVRRLRKHSQANTQRKTGEEERNLVCSTVYLCLRFCPAFQIRLRVNHFKATMCC
jgi:hypothetical protein